MEYVDRNNEPVPLAEVDTHAFAAQSAQHPPLQQRRSLTRGSGPPLDAVGASIVDEPLQVCLEAVPVDVAALSAGHHELPFGSRHHDHAGAAVRAASAAPT